MFFVCEDLPDPVRLRENLIVDESLLRPVVVLLNSDRNDDQQMTTITAENGNDRITGFGMIVVMRMFAVRNSSRYSE